MKSKMVSPPAQSLHQWHESLGCRILDERGRNAVSLACLRQLPATNRACEVCSYREGSSTKFAVCALGWGHVMRQVSFW